MSSGEVRSRIDLPTARTVFRPCLPSMTWALIYVNQKDPVKGRKLLDFLRYGLSEGQQSAAHLDYAPLPPNLLTQLRKRLGTVTVAAR